MCLNSSHKISTSTYTKDKTPEIGLQKYYVLKRGEKGQWKRVVTATFKISSRTDKVSKECFHRHSDLLTAL